MVELGFYFRWEMVVPTRRAKKIANDFRFVDENFLSRKIIIIIIIIVIEGNDEWKEKLE